MSGKRKRTDGSTETAVNRCEYCAKRKAVKAVKFPRFPVPINVCNQCAEEVS